ncbi:MAG: stage III sporulation protein AB [Oscillospiraceae bacterium]|jgi:stage III sporulation protein AA|nr:stage III sporulation protein AB [Oscillospiraceae bacterium]
MQSVSQEFLRAIRLVPPKLRTEMLALSGAAVAGAEELRLRIGRPPALVVSGSEIEILPSHSVTAAELQLVLELATRASAHTYADSIRQGFVTADGGCRVGICGTAVAEDGRITGLRRFSSVCIRIPREKRGCADALLPDLTERGFESLLIVSPPGAGKTTLLRELVRLLSDGGRRVSLVDERSEVAGSFEGQPCFDVGARTDVLTGAPKGEGIFLLLRAMSPQIIAFDEITSPADIEAAEAAANCGVSLIATAHGNGVVDLAERALYKKLLDKRIFRRAVVIENRRGIRHYTAEALT